MKRYQINVKENNGDKEIEYLLPGVFEYQEGMNVIANKKMMSTVTKYKKEYELIPIIGGLLEDTEHELYTESEQILMKESRDEMLSNVICYLDDIVSHKITSIVRKTDIEAGELEITMDNNSVQHMYHSPVCCEVAILDFIPQDCIDKILNKPVIGIKRDTNIVDTEQVVYTITIEVEDGNTLDIVWRFKFDIFCMEYDPSNLKIIFG